MNTQRILFVKIPPLITDTLHSIWGDVMTLRLQSDKSLLGIPVGCYYGDRGRSLYNALRATKRELYIEGGELTKELDKAIAWARGIHCGHPRTPLEGEITDEYFHIMTASSPALSV
jgi:hypothetical protein